MNQIYDPSGLMPAALKLAHELAKKSPLALAYAKEATNLYLTGEASAGCSAARSDRLFQL